MDADGGDIRQLATDIDVRGGVDWSRDGKWIVAGGEISDRPGSVKSGLFKIPADGRPWNELASGVSVNPVCSPDDDLVLYAGENTGGQVRLHGVRADTKESVDVPETVMSGTLPYFRFIDERRVVFVQWPRSEGFHLLDLTTRTIRRLTHFEAQFERGLRAFDVTGDGKIVFDRVSENSDLVLIKRPPR